MDNRSTHRTDTDTDRLSRPLTRRQILRLGGGLTLAAITAPILAACGNSSNSGGGSSGTSSGGGGTSSASSGQGAVGQATQETLPTPSAPVSLGGWKTKYNGPTTLSRFGFTTDDPTGKYHVELFQKAYPKIKLEVTPEFDDQKILTSVASGDVPDLFWLDRSTIVSWGARGAIEPVDDLIKNDSRFHMDDFYPSVAKNVQYNGKTWGVPQFVDCRPLWLDIPSFQDAGLDVNSVDTSKWPQLLTYAKKLEKKKGDKIMRWGFDTKAQDDSFFWMWCWGNGGNLLSSDGKKATISSDQNIEALEFCLKIVNAQGGQQKHDAFIQTTGFEGKTNFLAKDQVAATLFENWLLNIVGEADPNHKLKVVPFKGKDGKVYSILGGNAWAIPHGAKNKEASWEWISFMSDPQIWVQDQKLVRQENEQKKELYTPSITGNQKADQMIMKEVFKPTGNPSFDDAIKLFPDLIAKNQLAPVSPVLKEIQDAIHDQGVMPALSGQKSPKDSLADAQQKAQKAIDDFFKK